MKPYIIFAATCHNGSAYFSGRGTWMDTQYVLYSNGLCWKQDRFDRDCQDGKELPQTQKVCTYRLDAQAFLELQQLLQTQFDSAKAQYIPDWTYWDMHRYGPTGAKLCTVHGGIKGVPVLERIEYLLKTRQ